MVLHQQLQRPHCQLQSFSVEAIRGRRPKMEDAFCHGRISISTNVTEAAENVNVGGCFDGHGGDFVAKYIARNIPDRICSRLSGTKVHSEDVAAALAAAFRDLDEELHSRKEATLIGSTALVALVTSSMIHICSCGDSRAVICHDGQAIQPVQDHTPLRKDEQARIQQAGGQVVYHNGCRVMGALAMSRAIGDHALRPYGVIADPDVAHYQRRPGDEFLLLASDGLWAAVSNEDAARITGRAVTELSAAGMSRQQISAVLPKLLTKVALARGSSDNITVLVMDLKQDGSSSSSSSPRRTSSGSTQLALAAEACGGEAAAPPADVRSGSRCSVTDDDVSVTAAAVDCMRAIIREAASDAAWIARSPQQQAPSATEDGATKQLAAVDSNASGPFFPAAAGAATGNVALAAAAATKNLPASPSHLHTPSPPPPPPPAAAAPVAVAAALLPQSNSGAIAVDSAFASPFVIQQQAVLTQVWQDWSGMQDGGDSSNSGTSTHSSNATGSGCRACCCTSGSCCCGGLVAMAATAAVANSNTRKRRMVTTEAPGAATVGDGLAKCQPGPAGGVMGLTLPPFAPAKLQRMDSQSAAQRMLPIVQQSWAAATSEMARQLPMRVVA